MVRKPTFDVIDIVVCALKYLFSGIVYSQE